MGSLLSYSGLSVKIRSMMKKLTNEEQFQEITQLSTVPQIVAYLKKTPEYEIFWESLDESTLHRGQIETLLRKSIFQDFTKIYRFANEEQRNFLSLYAKRYEILIIKECIRMIYDHRDINIDLAPYRDFFSHHSKFDLERMVECRTMEELMNVLKSSEYYNCLSKLQGRDNPLAFDYGMAIDLYYFSHIWKIRKKLFGGKDLAAITKAYGGKFDLINLQWIQRSKQYYNMAPADIYMLLIPLNYKLRKSDIQALVEAPNMQEFQKALDRTYYAARYKETLTPASLEDFYTYLLRTSLEQESRKNPYSVAILYSFMYHKEHEVDRLTTAIECVRYGVSPEEALNYIHKN